MAAFDDAQAREAIVKEERQKQVLSMLHEVGTMLCVLCANMEILNMFRVCVELLPVACHLHTPSLAHTPYLPISLSLCLYRAICFARILTHTYTHSLPPCLPHSFMIEAGLEIHFLWW